MSTPDGLARTATCYSRQGSHCAKIRAKGHDDNVIAARGSEGRYGTTTTTGLAFLAGLLEEVRVWSLITWWLFS